MGRWLDALKNHDNGDSEHLQNPQKYPAPIFEGFEGSPPGHIEKFSEPSDGILKVLRVPVSSEIEKIPDLSNTAGYTKTDAELYIDALRVIGPCGYGPIAVYLGWGATKAGQVETELRLADLITYDSTGRAIAVEETNRRFKFVKIRELARKYQQS